MLYKNNFVTNIRLLTTILLVVSSTLSFYLSAEVYTLTDENGKIHFSDKLVDNEKVTTVQLKENNNIANTVIKDNQWQQDYNKTKQAKTEKTEKNTKQARKNKGYCDRMKSKVAIYDQGGCQYIMSPEGERTYQSEAQLAAKKKRLTKLI